MTNAVQPPRIEVVSPIRRGMDKLKRRMGSKPPAIGDSSGAPPIGVGLIGAGTMARWWYAPRLRSESGFRLASVFDVDKEAAGNFAGAFGAQVAGTVDEVLANDDVQAVLIVSPHRFHAEAAIKALDAGKHVLCEKPMAASMEEASAMYEAAKRSGKTTMVHFTYRFRPETAFMMDIVRSGMLGTVYQLQGTFGQGGWFGPDGKPSQERGNAADWRFGPDGGIVFELGPHLIDLCRNCFGECDKVQAWTRTLRSDSKEAEDLAGFTLSFGDGPTAQLLTSRWATGQEQREMYEISGSKGTLVFDQKEVRLWTLDQPKWRVLVVPPEYGTNVLSRFRLAIEGKAEVPGFWDGLKNNEILEGILRSASSGSDVSLPLAGTPTK